MTNITPPSGLEPKQKFSPELGEAIMNVDAAIAMMRDTDTPQAKALYRVFRKRLALEQDRIPAALPQKQRERALFATFEEVGIRLVDKGTLDETFPA